MSKPTEIDWAMLAAYIDGEGSILLHEIPCETAKSKKTFILQVCVNNTDPALTAWCRKTFGGAETSTLKYDAKTNRKCILFRWIVSARLAEAVLMGCLPYFIIKPKQAEVALAFRRTYGKRHNRYNPIPEEVLQERGMLVEILQAIRHERLEIVLGEGETLTEVPAEPMMEAISVGSMIH